METCELRAAPHSKDLGELIVWVYYRGQHVGTLWAIADESGPTMRIHSAGPLSLQLDESGRGNLRVQV